jgi:5'-deoxynucleotidase YfbR-like HD superfamily hydrolase
MTERKIDKKEIEEIYTFLSLIGKLKWLERFKDQVFWRGYENAGMLKNRRESVLDHTARGMFFIVLVHSRLGLKFDLLKTVIMFMIHDVPELIAGDDSPLGESGTGQDSHTYDVEKKRVKFEKEKAAAIKIFGTLPKDLGDMLLSIWLECEEGKTNEAKITKATDKIESRMQAFEYTQGEIFPEHLDFTLNYGIKATEVDQFLNEFMKYLGDLIKDNFKEFKK